VSGPPNLLGKAVSRLGGLALNVGSTGSESVNRGFVPGQKVAPLGEQGRARLGELYEGPALVELEPTLGDSCDQGRR
jgi:hypothetical protein